MTFVPLLGYYIQRVPARKEPTLEEKRQRGFYGFYNRLVGRAIQRRWYVLLGHRILADRRLAASHSSPNFSQKMSNIGFTSTSGCRMTCH